MKKADIIKEIGDFDRTIKKLEKEFPKARIIKGEFFELKAKLEGYNLAEQKFKGMIDKKIKDYEKWWLDAHKKKDKQTEDIFYNTLTNLKELKKELTEE